MDSAPPHLPSLVRKRDGRTEPFDADRINQALFAATELLGRPDAFTARELTDSILFFLPEQADGDVIAVEDVHDVMLKVVRELGQPPLAFALEALRREHAAVQPASASPAAVPSLQEHSIRAIEAFAAEHVFARNLTTAHEEGLIQLRDLALPQVLIAAVMPLPLAEGADTVFETIEAARSYIGGCVAVAGFDRELAIAGATPTGVGRILRDLDRAGRTLGLEVILNVVGGADRGEDDEPAGLAFPDVAADRCHEVRTYLLRCLREHRFQRVRLHWHLTGADFADESKGELAELCDAIAADVPLTLALDRPRRPIVLGPGLNAKQRGLLQRIDIDLRVLLERHGKATDAAAFAGKTLSLARLAASAGVQKRTFLRDHAAAHWPPFLLDRAHFTINLMGLSEILAQLFPRTSDARDAVDYSRELLQRLKQTVIAEANVIHMGGLVALEPTEVTWANDGESSLPHMGRGYPDFENRYLNVKSDRPMNVPALVGLLQFLWRRTGALGLRIANAKSGA